MHRFAVLVRSARVCGKSDPGGPTWTRGMARRVGSETQARGRPRPTIFLSICTRRFHVSAAARSRLHPRTWQGRSRNVRRRSHVCRLRCGKDECPCKKRRSSAFISPHLTDVQHGRSGLSGVPRIYWPYRFARHSLINSCISGDAGGSSEDPLRERG